MSARTWTLVLVGTLALVAVPLAGAQEPTHRELTFKASENCPADKNFCFEVTEGNAAEIQAGDHLMITFINEATTAHNLFVTTLQDRDANRQATAADAAFGNSSASVAPGAISEFTAQVPSDADGVYFWCDIGGHEAQGMWWEESFGGFTTAGSDGSDVPPEADEVTPGTPVPPALGLVALVLAVLLVRRRPA